jgi:drug/metabolite transporter (DMT)-like permease
MTMVPAAIGAIITGSSPLVTAVVAHMFMSDDKMNPAKTLSLIIGVMGISIISFDRNPLTWNGMTHFAGIILVALAVLSSAFGNIIIAKNKNSADPLLLNSVQLFLGGLFLLILGVSIEGTPKILDQPPIFYGALLWLSFLSAAAFSIWFILLKKYNAKVSYLNMWKFIVPALGALLSWVLLPEEKATLPQIIGIACVTASIMMCNRAYSKA